MHNNYYFLKQLTSSLNDRLKGRELISCFSQNKNELIVIFEDFIIKAHLAPAFCCLAFPKDFQRARKNSVDLFDEIIGQKVNTITQYSNERCFSIDFIDGHQLLFKMHGNRSNVILMSNGNAERLFINRLSKDHLLQIDQMDRLIDQSFDAFQALEGNYKSLFPTFGKVVQQFITDLDYDLKSISEKWKILESTLKQLEARRFYIEPAGSRIQFTLLKPDQSDNTFHDPIEALNYFFNQYISETTLSNEKNQVTNKLILEIKRLENYITKSEKKLNEIENGVKYNHLADILMANLHEIKRGLNHVTLANFYQNNELIGIKIKRDLSPQQNAENYYKKSKNQNLEISILRENIDNKIIQLTETEDLLSQINEIETLKELRKFIKTEELGNVNKGKQISRPYFMYQFMGFDIYVGKNAKANDDVLRNYSYKEDLWLHAKDVSGSHVLVKHKAGKEFTTPLIEKAAQLAAYYSKRKSDTLCPVIYTPRKFVRKRKNDPPGAVVVEREKVLLVEPRKF